MINNEYEKVELYFSCRNLPNLDILSKTDTKILLFEKNFNNNSWSQIGETETINDNLNPDFSRSIIVNFIFEKSQSFKVELRDIDGKNEFDFIGEVIFDLGQVIGSNKLFVSNINNKKVKNSLLQIRYEKVCKEKSNYKFKLSCTKIKDIRFFSKSKPFLKIYKYFSQKQVDDNLKNIAKNQWQLIYESEFYKNLNPSFKLFNLSSSKLCNNDTNKPIKIEVWDNHVSNGEHKIIGELYFILNSILNGDIKLNFTKINSDNVVGILNIESVIVEKDYDLIDYIRSGIQIQTCLAVDFTQSNGAPNTTDSLHYMYPNGTNLYQKALYETSKILLNYDYTKDIPLFGFGLKLPNDNTNKMLELFPMTFDWNKVTVNSLNGILDSYNKFINSIIFSGPTYFAPIINYICNIVEQSYKVNNLKYFVLTILTDGTNHDLPETVNSIIKASKLPISIIIVGIGNANFSNMKFLDGDDQKLKNNNGDECLRDIVQFVSFREFNNNEILLTQEILKEIPQQMNEFYRYISYVPTNNYNQQ